MQSKSTFNHFPITGLYSEFFTVDVMETLLLPRSPLYPVVITTAAENLFKLDACDKTLFPENSAVWRSFPASDLLSNLCFCSDP